MPVIALSIKHGRSLEEARAGLEKVVDQVQDSFGPMLQRVEWQPGRERVKLLGTGFELEMHVDSSDVHITGDIPLLGRLLGDRLFSGIKAIVQTTFHKRLTP